MTENLRLVGPRTLTSANSDVSNTFVIPSSSTGDWSTQEAHLLYTNDSSYGTLYNWLAATAGVGNADIGPNEYVDESICPKNWMLPHYNIQNKNYPNLIYNTYNISYGEDSPDYLRTLNLPLNFVLAGTVWSDGAWRNSGSDGVYWGNMIDAYENATYFLLLDNTKRVDCYGGGDRFLVGASIRCLAR